MRDALEASKAPIIASHSSARALVDHKRNIPDDILRAIAAKGGVIQAVAYKEFVKHDPARAEAEKRSEEHTSELQSLMRISYAVFCLKKKKKQTINTN